MLDTLSCCFGHSSLLAYLGCFALLVHPISPLPCSFCALSGCVDWSRSEWVQVCARQVRIAVSYLRNSPPTVGSLLWPSLPASSWPAAVCSCAQMVLLATSTCGAAISLLIQAGSRDVQLCVASLACKQGPALVRGYHWGALVGFVHLATFSEYQLTASHLLMRSAAVHGSAV